MMQMGGSITYTENIASRSNDGNYNCTATNTVGSETESRSVLVIGMYVTTYPGNKIRVEGIMVRSGRTPFKEGKVHG